MPLSTKRGLGQLTPLSRSPSSPEAWLAVCPVFATGARCPTRVYNWSRVCMVSAGPFVGSVNDDILLDVEPSFTRFFATPHGLDLGKVADLYGIPFSRAESLAAFRASLPALLSKGGPFILEVRTDRETTHGRRREVISAVERAMERAEWLGGSHGPGGAHPHNPEPEQGIKE